MLARLRRRLSYANVVASLALFAALGGTSYAALTITSKNVKNGTLKSVDIKNNSIKSVDVRNRSLLRKDFKPGQLPSGAQGPSGAPGATGAKGDTGAPGSPAASAFTARFASQFGGGFGPVSDVHTGTGNAEASVQQISPAATIIARDLFARHVSDPPAAGAIRGFILRVNGADTALSCTYTQPEQSCQNTSAAVTIPPGSLLSIRTVQAGTTITGGGSVLVSFRATTP